MDLAFVLRLGVLLVRPSALVAMAPPFGGAYTPVLVKIGFSVILALVLAPAIALPPVAGSVALVVIIAREVLIGVALAMTVRLLLAGVELAGQLAGFQLGLMYAGTVDPQTGARDNAIASLYANLALFTFLAIDAHHVLLRGLARSYAWLPVGMGGVDASLAPLVAKMLGAVFVIGAQLAAPIVVVLLVVELALGLLTRAAPALNMMVIGFPIRLIAGLLVLAATISVVPGITQTVIPPLVDLMTRVARALH
jgi:flagellar biosynthesis protein FliR